MPHVRTQSRALALARTGADDARPSHGSNLLTNLHGHLAGATTHD